MEFLLASDDGMMSLRRAEVYLMDLHYAVVLEPDDGAFQVIVPAFPEIHTFAETVDEALASARDAIQLSIAVRRDEGAEIPAPDAGNTRLETVAVNPHAA